jgi:hypothetical protein
LGPQPEHGEDAVAVTNGLTKALGQRVEKRAKPIDDVGVSLSTCFSGKSRNTFFKQQAVWTSEKEIRPA